MGENKELPLFIKKKKKKKKNRSLYNISSLGIFQKSVFVQ